MKNNLFKITLTIFLVLMMFTFVGCTPDNDGDDPTPAQTSKYTVSFETFGGSTVESVTVEAGTTVQLTDYTTTKTNYTFEGWYTDQYFNQKVTEVKVNKNVTLYAGYQENKFKVEFETDGGSEVAPIEAYRGSILKAPADPTKEGYVFGGWYRDAEFVFVYEFLDNAFMHANDLTLYAKWIEARTITIEYVGIEKEDLELNGVESTEVETVNETIEGYIFEGFYTDAECTTEYTFSVYPSEDVTVFAKYHLKNDNVTLTYVSLGETYQTVENLAEQDLVEDLVPVYPFEESRDYYFFDCWYIDENYTNKFDGVVPQSDTTLYARWIRDGKYVCISFEGLDETYYIKKGSLISNEIFEEYLANIEIPDGMIMDGYVTSEGSTFSNKDYAYRDMTLSPNIYSDGLEFEPVYIRTMDGEGNIISVVSGYAVKSFIPKNGSVETLVLPDYYQGYKVTEISDSAFLNNTNFKNIELPKNIETIRENAFKGNSTLSSIAFPKTLKVIEDSAFLDCVQLAEVSYSGRLTNVGYKVFENTAYLQSLRAEGEGGIYIGAENEVIYEYNRDLAANLHKGAKAVFGNKGATIVAGGAFEDITELAYISLPNTITIIGKFAFRNCTGLEEVVINSDLTTIEEGAFSYCSSLKVFVFPETLSQVGDEAFRYSGLTDVTLNLVMEDYGKYVFANCENLVNVVVYIQSQLTSIKEGMFYGCTSLEGFICTDLITTIESYAFAGCTSLDSIYLGYTTATTISKVEANAFEGCDALKRVYFLRLADASGNIVEVDENAFPHQKTNGEPTTYKFYVPNTTYSNADFEGTYQEYYISKLPKVYETRILPYDTTRPTIKTYISSYQIDPNASVDVYDLIANGGVYSATDDTTATEDLILRINSVKFNNTVVLNPVEGTKHVYDMTNGGSYTVSYSILDEFGNATAGSLTILVYEKEL